MKKALKILLAILVGLVLVLGGTSYYMTRNMKRTEDVVLEGVKTASIQDGTYQGSYSGGRFSNKLEVIVKDQKIQGVKILKDVTFAKQEVSKELFDKVVAAQNTAVDVVSGSTVTSKAYLSAIEEALKH